MITQDTILNADIMEVLPQIPDGTFDCVLSDPPYQIETHGRGIGNKRKIFKDMSDWTNLNNDWYNDNILKEYVRICKFPNLFLFGGKRDVYKMLRFAEESGYFYHIIAVCKKVPIPMTDNTWLNNEYAVHIVDRKLVYTKEYNLKIPYFIVGGQKTTGHPNEKDLPMMKRIVANITREGILYLTGLWVAGQLLLLARTLKDTSLGVNLTKIITRNR